MTSNAELARRLATAGVPVFPCREATTTAHDGRELKAKAPYTVHGFKDATTDPEQVATWWELWPAALPGVPTGEASGLAVLDADTDPEGHPVGVENIHKHKLAHADAVEVKTPSGGAHYYYAHVDGARNTTAAAAPYVDTRGTGGYVIAPGSTLPDGRSYAYVNGRTLSKALGELPLFPLDAVNELIAARKAALEPKLSECAMPVAPSLPTAGTGDGWAKAAMQGELAKLLAAPVGARNATLNAAAFSLGQIVASGGLDETTVRERLSAAASGIGLEPGEIAATVASGIHAGAKTPRGPRGRDEWEAGVQVTAATTNAEGPQPLIRDMPDADPFPVAALGPLAGAAEAIATITEAPPALCAASTLAAAALAVQGLADVETLGGPRPVSLFLLTVAESGERKSTADKRAMQGVRDFENSLRPDYDEDREAWGHDAAIWEKRRNAILRTADENPHAARTDLLALGPEPEAPLRPSIVTGSATMEGIIKHLPGLRASLGIMTDEGGLLLGGHSMKSENRLATLATLAAMWDGAALDRWRAGDGVSVYVGRRFSAHLLIQPSAAEGFLADPLANGQGLLARFLTCRPASHIGHRLRISDDPAAKAEAARFAARIETLLGRPMALAEGRRNELAPPVLPLSAEARDVLVDFARAVEEAQAPGGAFEDARAFASKTAEHAARLAGVMALFADPAAAAVTGEEMANAVALATYYANEAARLLNAAVIPPHVQDAERMRRWLLGSWAEPFVTARAAAQRGPFKLTERSRKALSLLEAYGWLILTPDAEVQGKPRREAWKVVRS